MNKIFLPHISKQLESCIQVDIVWDIYVPNSIKESTREKEGRESEGKWKVKISCLEFLRDATNKQELFGFISNKVAAYSQLGMHCPENKEMFITLGSTAIIRGSNMRRQIQGS